MDIKADEKRFPDPIVEKLINYPDQIQICDEIGLENLKPRDNVILLSKPPFGPPLYWHQDFMNWDHPEAACPWPTVIFLFPQRLPSGPGVQRWLPPCSLPLALHPGGLPYAWQPLQCLT